MNLLNRQEKDLSIEAQARLNAIQQIEALFSAPESTKQINEKEMEIIEKSESLDARLKTCIQEELEGYSIGLSLLEKSQVNASEIDKLSLEIADICQKCDDLFKNYALVKEITTIKRNLKEVIDTVKYLRTLKEKKKEIKTLLENHANIIRAHQIVRAYEMLRSAIEKQIAKFNLPYTADVDPYFQEIVEIRQSLMSTIEDIFKELVDVANKTPEILVKVAVIVERDRRDRELILQKAKADSSQHYEYETVNYYEMIQKMVVLAAEEFVNKNFENATKPWVNTVQTMQSLQRYLDELTIVSFDADQCFPPEYKIKETYLKVTAEMLYKQFKKWSSTNKQELGEELISNMTIISLLKWVNDDYVPTLNRIGIDPKAVPNFIEALQGAQFQYVQRVKEKMFGWVPNIATEDLKQTPVKINRLAYTTAPVDLFGIVKEQIEMAKQSKSSEFIFQVVNALVIPLEQYPNYVKSQVEEKLNKLNEQLNSKKKKKKSSEDYDEDENEAKEEDDEDMIDVQYMCAMINNCNKCISNTNEMVENVSSILEPGYGDRFDFSTVEKKFDDLIETCCLAIREKVLADCDEVMNQLFDDEYYDEDNLVELMVGCMDDYCSNDIEDCLLEVYAKQITEQMVREFVDRYLTQLCSKKHKFNKKDRTNTGTMIKKDFEMLSTQMSKHLDIKKLGTILGVINGFGELLEQEPDGVRAGCQAILSEFKDCPIEMMKFIIGERDDFGSSEKDTAYECIENYYENTYINLNNFKPTVLSKIQIPSKFGLPSKK